MHMRYILQVHECIWPSHESSRQSLQLHCIATRVCIYQGKNSSNFKLCASRHTLTLSEVFSAKISTSEAIHVWKNITLACLLASSKINFNEAYLTPDIQCLAWHQDTIVLWVSLSAEFLCLLHLLKAVLQSFQVGSLVDLQTVFQFTTRIYYSHSESVERGGSSKWNEAMAFNEAMYVACQV